MEIIWDEMKRKKNLEKHGFDFAHLDDDFFSNATVLPAKSGRLMAIGVLANGMIAVVFVELGREAISIVSMRRASRKERSIL